MIFCKNIRKKYPLGHGRFKKVLHGLNLDISPGQRIGFLGRNGAGKTTLIKLLGGVEQPTSGTISRHMTVSWPLGFGGGFQGSLTGNDNARFIARIYGKEYSQIRSFVEDFSELGSQLRNPVKTYSAGMQARLAFGLSLAIEFDCYLIDEVIMVGDHNFHQKCHDELFVKRQDRALVLASHSAELIRNHCNMAMVLHDGQGTIYNDLNEALETYNQL